MEINQISPEDRELIKTKALHSHRLLESEAFAFLVDDEIDEVLREILTTKADQQERREQLYYYAKGIEQINIRANQYIELHKEIQELESVELSDQDKGY